MPVAMKPVMRNLAQPEETSVPSDASLTEWDAELGQRLKEIEDRSSLLEPFDETVRKTILRIAVMLVSGKNAPQCPQNRQRVSMYGALKGKVGMTSDFDAPVEDFAEYM